jgi:hypothetical protein
VRREGLVVIVWLLVLGGSSAGVGKEDQRETSAFTQPVDITPRAWSGYEHLAQVNPQDPGLASYAKRFGVSTERAVLNLSIQEEVSRRRDVMRAAAEDAYATVAMTQDERGTVRVHATSLDAAERMVKAYVDALGPPVSFEYVRATFGLSTLSVALEEVDHRLTNVMNDGSVGPGSESSRAEIDPIRGEIVVLYDSDFDDDRVVETRTAAGPPVRYQAVDFDITSRNDSCSWFACDMPFHGGLTVTDGGTCTSGFNAQVGSDAKLLSAGHCSDGLGTGWNHNRPSSASDYVGAVEFAIDTAVMDVARVNVVDSPWEQAPMNSIFRRSSPELGVNVPNFAITFRNSEPGMFDWVCRSGATTGERCGTAVAFSAEAGQIYKVRIEDAKACGGDSGGPWYTLGRSAYGIHESSQSSTADCPSEPESEDSYAYTIRRAEDYAGATVVTVGSRSPFGHLDGASRVPGAIRVQGWAVDPDVLSPIVIHIYVDVTGYDIGPASTQRADVDAVYPLYDADVGFDAYVAVGPGPNNVCAYAINLDLGSHVGLNCIFVP